MKRIGAPLYNGVSTYLGSRLRAKNDWYIAFLPIQARRCIWITTMAHGLVSNLINEEVSGVVENSDCNSKRGEGEGLVWVQLNF